MDNANVDKNQFIEINESVKNLESVFLTVATRPQLIFDNIKYCLLYDDSDSPLERELFLQSVVCHSLFHNAPTKDDLEITKFVSGEVLICQDVLHNLFGYRTESYFVIAILESETQQIHSHLTVYCNSLSFKITLGSTSWSGEVDRTSPKVQKLVKWLTVDDFEVKPPANSAICPKQYYLTYNHLKDKYVQKIFDAWDMQTDPDKFIHEDIGIASYLICLWKSRYGDMAHEYIKFVDIGCGNGLLVYLLNQESFKGIGIDVKARNIWHTLFSESCLKEQFFDPKNWTDLIGYNWIIGNHSDELTPWLPYVASMISYKCEFFVLPCCPWNFTAKYCRMNAALSTYHCYLDYIESLISEFGFEYQKDIMKIPSTKRTCFISDGRTFSETDNEVKQTQTLDVVQRHSGGKSDLNCVARSKEIKVRNGTKIDMGLCTAIVDFTAGILLKNVSSKDSVWSAGESMHLKELVAAIKQNISFQDALKDQYGGIQTVLKNNHQLFVIRSGMVTLKDWSKDAKKPYSKKPNRKYDSAALHKSKLCWFHKNHPQGCNLSAQSCRYAHGSEELKIVNC